MSTTGGANSTADTGTVLALAKSAREKVQTCPEAEGCALTDADLAPLACRSQEVALYQCMLKAGLRGGHHVLQRVPGTIHVLLKQNSSPKR